jgi:hypothetical protein
VARLDDEAEGAVMTTIDTTILPRRHRPSFGRPRSIRGLDLFDTPPKALDPLFVHEPLLRGVTCIGEHFAGKGNFVIPMRARGITVHASDILDRGCPDSSVFDFFAMTTSPPNCRVILTNPAFTRAMDAIEHALAIGFDVVIFLLKLSFLCTADRFERLHKAGHLRRVHVLAERLQDMHDAAHLAAGGNKAGQSADARVVCFRCRLLRSRRHQPGVNQHAGSTYAVGQRGCAMIPAEIARAARAALRTAFPDSKFSVTSGRAVGAIEAVVALCPVPTVLVEASGWKRQLHLPGKDKEAARQRALQLFPAQHALLARKRDHGRAEAALIVVASVSANTEKQNSNNEAPAKAIFQRQGI